MATTEPRVTEIEPQEGLVYDGFISYSHAADDLLAPRLQAGLQRFAKPWWKRRALRIFRDESSLSANPHLWSSITDAVDQSAWFVLLLSPEAANSEWVNREIDYWLEHKDPSRIIPVVTAGEFGWGHGEVTGDACPPALFGVFIDEPRWVDLRFAKSEEQLDLNNASFRAAVADVASAIRQVPKDELESEEVRQHRRTTSTAWAAVLALLILGVGAAATAVFAVGQSNEAQAQRDEAERQTAVAEEQQAEAEAQTEIAQEQRDRAELLALETISARLITESAAARTTEPEVADLLAVEARRRIDIEVTRANLARGVLSAWGLSRTTFPSNVAGFDAGPDGTWTAVTYGFGTSMRVFTPEINRDCDCYGVVADFDLVAQRPGARRLEIPGALFPSVDLSDDGSRLVVSYRDAPTLRTEALVLDANTFTPLGDPIPGPLSSAAISPDGGLVAVASSGSGSAPLGTVQLVTIDGEVVTTLPDGSDGQIEGNVAFSRDGTRLVSGQRRSGAAVMKVWDVATGELLVRHELGAAHLLGSPAISPDGRYAAISAGGEQGFTSNTNPGWVTVIDVEEATPIAVIELETFTPNGITVAFGTIEPVLAIGDASGISIYSTETFEPTERINDLLGATRSLALRDSDRKLFATGSGLDLTGFDLTAPDTGSVELPVTGITALSPVGDTIAVIEDIGLISFWSARSGEQIGTAAITIPGAGGLGRTPEAVAEIGGVPVFSADGTKLYVRNADGRFSIVEVSTGEVVDMFELPIGRTHRALAVSGDSIATGHSDGTVMLWDAATFGSTDDPVATWQLADQVGECAPPGNPRLDGIRRLSIRESTGGLEVIVVDQCDVGIGWRILDSEPTRAVTFTNSRVVDFGPDGSYVRSPVTARLQLFSSDGSEGRNFDAHRGPIRQTSLSHDGSTMASVSDDMIGLWYTASGEILATGITGAQAHVSSDGSLAVTSGAAAFDWFGGPVVVWDLDPDSWQERACDSAGRNLSFFEWEQFFPDEAYRITCPQWPSGL